jgi:hypothetical protein
LKRVELVEAVELVEMVESVEVVENINKGKRSSHGGLFAIHGTYLTK